MLHNKYEPINQQDRTRSFKSSLMCSMSLKNKGYIDQTIKRLQKQDGQYISNQEEVWKNIRLIYDLLHYTKKENIPDLINVG